MVDWWALGILITEMVIGSPPFSDISPQRVIRDIVELKFKPADWLTANLKKLLIGLLKKDPNERLGSPKQGGV